MKRPKVAIHTDVFVDYLLHDGRRPPVLRIAMEKFFCYTTVFNAIELFSMAATPREQESVRAVLSAVKLLGLNGRNAPRYGGLLAGHPGVPAFSMLIAGLCLESRLPLLTGNAGPFRGIRGLRLISTAAVEGRGTGAGPTGRRAR